MTKATHILASLAVVFSTGIGVAYANPVNVTPGDELHTQPAKRGWFWYLSDEEKKKEAAPEEQPAPEEVVEEKKAPLVVIGRTKEKTPEELCADKETWTSSCGFIDPGDDFEFQAKQRDILLQAMSLTPDNPKAVEAAQYYMKWVVGKASMAANMWYFNMVQNPDLDPTVKNPISEVGIALASRVNKASQSEYFRVIKEEGGILFFFTRNDCIYCHDQSPYTIRVAETMGLPLINVPLDNVCLPDFYDISCAENIPHEHLAVLDVKMVPALYLYVPTQTWIRLGSGMMSDSTILGNAVNFFSAYRAALLHGIDNGDGVKPSVTFDPTKNAPLSGTMTVAPEGGQAKGDLPVGLNKENLLKLMGY